MDLRFWDSLAMAKVGLMTPKIARYMNRIDMGIYLCIPELCLKHRNIPYTLQLHPEDGAEGERTLAAVITLD